MSQTVTILGMFGGTDLFDKVGSAMAKKLQ